MNEEFLMIARQALESIATAHEAGLTISVLLAGSTGQGVTLCGDMLVEAALVDGRAADVREEHVLRPPSTPAAVTCTVYLAGEADAPLTVPRLTELDGALILGDSIAADSLARLKPDAWAVIGHSGSVSGLLGRTVRPQLPQLARVEVAGPLVRAMALLGVLSQRLPMETSSWRAAFESHLPARQRVACWDAFLIGRHAKV
jgi:hypothetical protein